VRECARNSELMTSIEGRCHLSLSTWEEGESVIFENRTMKIVWRSGAGLGRLNEPTEKKI
jgi:hypothetical protein